MSNQNALALQKQMTAFLTSGAVKNKINSIVSDPKRGAKFVSSLVSAVNNNPALAECDQGSLINSALLGEALNLSPSPQLGQYYMVPFKDRKNNRTVATFVLGYKGYIQLAMRTGQYRTINAVDVKEGELKGYDRLSDEVIINWLPDGERANKQTVGYVAMFELTNGFRKVIYWSFEKMKDHAMKYSAGYANDVKKGTNYTFWSKQFDDMAFKTMLRQLISKWGVMSIDMVDAYERDGAALDDQNNPIYVESNDANNQLELNQQVDEEANQQELVVESDEEDLEEEQPSF